MKKYILLCAAILGLCVPSFSLDRAFINKQYDPAVALMYSPDKEGDGDYDFRCTATAFAKVSDGYLFVSAAHCVEDNAPVFLSGDKPEDTPLPAEVIAAGDQTKNLDFSVLKLKAPDGMYTILPLGKNPTQKGERIFSISAPRGVGKAYIDGYISMPDIPTSQVIEEGIDWQHNILFDMPGSGPGSSGSTIVCEDQMKACAILVGHLEDGSVAEPIERFTQWWTDVQAGKISKMPPKHQAPVRPSFPLFPFPFLPITVPK